MANPCSFCKAECCKSYTITATAFDILRAMQRTGRSHEEFASLHQARLLAFDPDMTLDMEDDSWIYTLGFRSHPCVFLKNDRCAIHDCAPMACRRFPFTLAGELNTRFCPIPSQLVFRFRSPDVPADKMTHELEAHKKIVKEWNKKPGKKSECIGFLLEKARAIQASVP
ncbi:MAG: YkgJ family cysteine cluster protein [Candidatus ainarchaeum sp.]|nr:YkgJ family cysteine cluster protein [Candidatus ainarchaeum sp.]